MSVYNKDLHYNNYASVSQTSFKYQSCNTLTRARSKTCLTNTFYINANFLLFCTPKWRIKCFFHQWQNWVNQSRIHDCYLTGSSQERVLNLVSVGQTVKIFNNTSMYSQYTVNNTKSYVTLRRLTAMIDKKTTYLHNTLVKLVKVLVLLADPYVYGGELMLQCCVRPSVVCLSVMYVLWLNGAS